MWGTGGYVEVVRVDNAGLPNTRVTPWRWCWWNKSNHLLPVNQALMMVNLQIGAANTGGGGGGMGISVTLGGAGGSGVVIVRYPIGIDNRVAKATGGAVSYANGKTIHKFETSGTFTVTNPSLTSVDYLVVGGGGSGGQGFNDNASGGGGGAGGMRSSDPGMPAPMRGTALPVSAATNPVVIGSGGSGTATVHYTGSLITVAGYPGSFSEFGNGTPAPMRSEWWCRWCLETFTKSSWTWTRWRFWWWRCSIVQQIIMLLQTLEILLPMIPHNQFPFRVLLVVLIHHMLQTVQVKIASGGGGALGSGFDGSGGYGGLETIRLNIGGYDKLYAAGGGGGATFGGRGQNGSGGFGGYASVAGQDGVNGTGGGGGGGGAGYPINGHSNRGGNGGNGIVIISYPT